MNKRKRGRPPGSKNESVDQVDAMATCCRQCGSTEREPYFRTSAQEYAGLLATGQPYTHIVRRWTRCSACGQVRIDLFHENRVPTDRK